MSSSEEKRLPPKPPNSYQGKSAVQSEKISKENFGTALRKPAKFSESSSSANLKTTKHLNVATPDLNAIEPENTLYEGSVTPEARSTFANILRALKGKSKGQTSLLGSGTFNRGRFLSLDSSNIFQTPARNGNRRNSWCGGNIRNTSTKRNPSAKLVPVPKPNRRCSRTSIKTPASDGLPVHCGIHFDIRADVHRTASGEPTISTMTEKSFKVKPKEHFQVKRKEHFQNVIVNVDSHSNVEENEQNASQITVDPTQQLYELNGKVCKKWLEVIDRMTTCCPSCSDHIGPVLITVSLCAGLAIVLTGILAFTWLLNKLGYRWA